METTIPTEKIYVKNDSVVISSLKIPFGDIFVITFKVLFAMILALVTMSPVLFILGAMLAAIFGI